MWNAWHFEASEPTSPSRTVHCVHDTPPQLLHEPPNLLQANTNLQPNPAHLRAPSEWAWLELLVEK